MDDEPLGHRLAKIVIIPITSAALLFILIRVPATVIAAFGGAMAAAAAAYVTTFHYSYFPNENTRINGWSVLLIIFQRDSPEDQWLDFVGPTVFFALPMNFILYAFLPSLALLIFARVVRSRAPNSRAEL